MKMTREDWGRVKYFSPEEKWGDPLMMERSVVFLLDELRGVFHHPFIVHCGYQLRPLAPTSQHNFGTAVDFHIAGMAFGDAVDLMLRFIGPPPKGLGVENRIGLGIYPHWAHPGFHLDTRGSMARWGAININGAQTYVSFEEARRLIP
jgi:hypothetical protein